MAARRRRHLHFIAAAIGFASIAHAADVLVRNNAELISAINSAQPGDSIILRNGIWSSINLNNHLIPTGTAGNPINIRAQTPGQVVITGSSTIFDVRGSHYSVSGLSFKDTNDTLKSLRFRGDNARVFDNAILNFGRYNQILWDIQDSATNPTSSFDHNLLAGKKDRGVSIVLDGSLNARIKSNYFGHRDRGGPSGQTNGWETIRIGNSGIMNQSLGALIEGNYFEGAEGEEEIISDKTHDNIIRGNTFKDITKGRVTARHGGRGVYEGNYFLNAMGIRVGNAEDSIPDHPGLVIRNNYLEGANAKIVLPGYQADATIEGNTVVITPGAYISSEHTTGKMPLEYNNTTGGVIRDNIFAIDDSAHAAVQARTLGSIVPTATGEGNFAYNIDNGTNTFTSGVSQAIRDLFTVANPNLVRDSMGILRPTGAAAGKGFTGTSAPLTRTSDVGPGWMDPVMRLNKFTAAEFKFNGDLSGGAIDQTAHNSGYLITAATMRDGSGAAANLHSPITLGVSGSIGDRAFDNRQALAMGAAGGSAAAIDRTWFRNLQAFTITGWFRTDGAQTIGSNASLVEQMDSGGGWALRSTQNGRLSLTIHDGSTSSTVTSDQLYTQQDQWVFFAVRFDQRPSSNEVEFFVGTEATDVTSAGIRSLLRTASSDSVASDLIIGKGFDGTLDNVRLFGARRNITWVDEDGSVYTRTAVNHEFALLTLDDLKTVRSFDLAPFEQAWAQRWNVDSNGSWSSAGNWLGGVPNSVDAVVNFSSAISQDRTITLDGPRAEGIVTFDNLNRYTLAGSTLTMDVSSGSAEINVARGNHTIVAPVTLLDNTSIFVGPASSTLTLSGDMSAADGVSIRKLGAGNLEAKHLRADQVDIAAGNVAILPNGTSTGTSKLKTLTIAEGSMLDIADNALVLDHDGSSPLPTVRQQIIDGRFLSSMADGLSFGVGFAEASEIGTIPAIFGTVDSTAVLVRLTRVGDANLDGLVNLLDFNRLAANFGAANALWSSGDFNYDGIVNLIDFNRLAANFGLTAGPHGPTPQDWAALASAVPDPSAAGYMCVALLLCRRVRGRRHG